MKFWWLGIAAALVLSGCGMVQRAGIGFFYKEAFFSNGTIKRDIPYAGVASTANQRLDLYCPAGSNWPALIFAYGGGWTQGDKQLRVGGKDVYGNIGRFYAARGIGVALINYRLQPTVSWREQVNDVATAAAWVRAHIAAYGGNGKHLFLAGHSAGAYLVSFVALNTSELERAGLVQKDICGVICVSGAGLDLADDKTYELGASLSYYEKRFSNGKGGKAWQREASPLTYATSEAPPFLILYAGGEKKPLQRQAKHFHEILTERGASSRLVRVPDQSHARIVLTLSRPDKTAGPAILDFIHDSACPP